LSTGNAWTEMDLSYRGTTLIVGDNGSGKSTVLDALVYALFNRPFRRINKPQLVNSITTKGMLVEVEFSVGSSEYKVVRGAKPGVFEVWQDGRLLNQSADNRDYQDVLERQIIRVNYKSFSQVVVLGSASFVPFMALPTGARRDIIEDLLDLQIFTTMNSLLKDRAYQNSSSMQSADAEKRLLEERVVMTRRHLQELQEMSERLVEEKKERVTATNESLLVLQLEAERLESLVTTLRADLETMGRVHDKVKKLEELRYQIEMKARQYREEVRFFESHESCPTCHQSLDPVFKCEMIESNTDKIAEVEHGLELLAEKYREAEQKLDEANELSARVTKTNLELHTTRTQMNSLMDYVAELERELEKSRASAQEAADPTVLSSLACDLEEIERLRKDLIEERQVITLASSLLKDGGIKSKIIRQYVPIINKLINRYLAAMEFMVHFELNESFEETIKSRYRDDFSYASFSEGEKQRIDLAVLFTWRAVAKMRNSVSTNLLILDEIFDSSLDATGAEELMKILNSVSDDTNTLVISHRGDQLFDKFDRVLKFEKRQNFSRLAA
jgi:DNA repair exonuclease SbcCD ATPase subunit